VQDSLKPSSRKLLADEETELLLSTISIIEIAIKAGIGKLDFPEDMLVRAMDDLDLTVLPHTAAHARKLYALPAVAYEAENRKPKEHGDPFDRALIAAALAEDIPIVTSDAVFKKYKRFGLDVIQG
jgi:PIN domain nuclease of toxin-antitoxin system